MDSRSAITIGRIYLRKNIIQVQVKKSGTTTLVRKALNSAILTLAAGTAHKKWAMSKVDPHRNLLKGKMVIFDTGIHITTKTRAKAALTRIAGNQQKTVWLSPLPDRIVMGGIQAVKPGSKVQPKPDLKDPLQAIIMKTKRITKPDPSSKMPATKPMLAAKKPLPPKQTMMGKKIVPGHSPVPLILDRGIAVTEPNGRDYSIAGSQSLHIHYTIMREVDDATPVIITLRNRDCPDFSLEIWRTTARHARSPRDLDWPIPLSIDLGHYYIQVQAGELWGWSDPFSIVALLEPSEVGSGETTFTPINVTLEPSRKYYLPGEEITVRCRENAPYEIYLHQSGDSPARMTFWPLLWQVADGGMSYNEETGEYRIVLRLPDQETYQTGKWVIAVLKDSSIWEQSGSFSIGAITDAGASSPAYGANLVYPSGGETLVMGETYEFRWYYWGPEDPGREHSEMPSWHIFVRGADHHVVDNIIIGPEDYTLDETTRLCRASVFIDPAHYHGYHRRSYTVTLAGGDVSTRHREFTITSPLLIEGPFEIGGNTPLHTLFCWNRYEIRWRLLAPMEGDVSVYLAGAGYSDIIGTSSINPDSRKIRFTVPARTSSGTGVIEMRPQSHTGRLVSSYSQEFRVERPFISIMPPNGGHTVRNGNDYRIQWTAVHFPFTIGHATPTLTISLEGAGGRRPIVRGIPVSRSSYSWHVRNTTHSVDWGEDEGLEGVPLEYGTGHMGGLPDTIPAGDYRLVFELDQGHGDATWRSGIFHIE
jgi:hypothetical protein